MELDDLNLRNPIQLGFYDPFNIYPHLKDDLQKKFPLTNLHWKYHQSKPLKSIPLLPVKLIEEIPKQSNCHIKDSNIYSRLMFIRFDNLDTYRSQVRPLIIEWLKHLVLKSNVEWMIIFFVPSDSKDKGSLMKTSTFNKLKMDFGVDGKELSALSVDSNGIDRCFRLREYYESNILKLEAYNELITQLKDLLILSFDNKYQLYNNQLSAHKRIDFKGFLIKLNLADLLNDMRLLQDSLDIYNELSECLNDLYLKNPTRFNLTHLTIPNNFNNYQFEKSFNLPQIKLNLIKNEEEEINLFELKCLIFINQSILLQSLANFASTISISSRFISNLFQKLIYFLNDLSNTFKAHLDEMIFAIIDNYLNLPICNKLIDINNKNNLENDQNYQLNEILEFKGELKLFQRSKLVKIAVSHGFIINAINQILEEISLDDNKTFKESVSITYKPLLDILADKTTYYQYFEHLTELIIQDFVNSGRSKTIDILSIDLALLNYQKGNYQESLNILQDSYEFFILNGWNFMGGILLEIFLDCIEKVKINNNKLILMTSLKLFSNLVRNNNTVGINNYNLIKQKDQISKLFSKIEDYASRLNESIDFPIDNLFKIEILPFIKEDASTILDKYFIEMKLNNLFGISFKFNNIKLQLFNNENDLVEFETNDVKVSDKIDHTIKLYSNDFKLGLIYPSKLIININHNLELIQIFNKTNVDSDHANNTVIHNNNSILNDTVSNETKETIQANTSTQMYYCQNLDKLWCEFLSPFNIELGSTEIVLRLYNGLRPIENLKIELSSNTNGLKIDFQNLDLSIGKLSGNQIYDLKIPYSYYSDNKLINMKAKLIYNSNNESFTHSISSDVDTTLTISVSVQDIFKSVHLFSKFQVGTSNPKLPIRIISNDISTTNENFRIIKPQNSLTPLVAFGEQPASFFYKIVPISTYEIKSSDSLDLFINYSNLKNECENYLSEVLLQRFKELNLANYWFLFKNLILKELKFDLNSYAIYQSIDIVNSYETDLLIEKSILQYVEMKDDQIKLADLFKDILFYQPLKVDHLNIENRQLYISVPIPILKYLQIIEFQYERKCQYLVGDPIPMNLKVETITRWSATEKNDPTHNGDISILAESSPHRCSPQVVSKQNFQLLIQNDDNWLLSGFKKQSFEINDHSSNINTFEIILIPLNVGKLLLPKITVKSINGDLGKDFSMDTNFKNGSETLLVVPELDSITFSF